MLRDNSLSLLVFPPVSYNSASNNLERGYGTETESPQSKDIPEDLAVDKLKQITNSDIRMP